jgi:hypothetical protein
MRFGELDLEKDGGDARIRTEDLFHAMETLYQLSYIPTEKIGF